MFGEMIREFRKNVLHMTLKEVSEETKIPISTLSTVERGKSTNYKFIYVYRDLAKTEKQKQVLASMVNDIFFNEVK